MSIAFPAVDQSAVEEFQARASHLDCIFAEFQQPPCSVAVGPSDGRFMTRLSDITSPEAFVIHPSF